MAGKKAVISIVPSDTGKADGKVRIIRPDSEFSAAGAEGEMAGRSVNLRPGKKPEAVWLRGYGGGCEMLGYLGGKRILRKWLNFNSAKKWRWIKAGVFDSAQYEKLTFIVPATHKDEKITGAIDYAVSSQKLSDSPDNSPEFCPGSIPAFSQEEYLNTTFSFGRTTHRPYYFVKPAVGNDALLSCDSAIGGYCSRTLKVELPANGRACVLWLRGYGSGGELLGYRKDQRELRKWVNFNARGRWCWIRVGSFSSGEYDTISFIVPVCEKDGKLVGGVDCMVLTTDTSLNPETGNITGPSNVFNWQPTAAAVGTQPFEIKIEGPSGKFTKTFDIRVNSPVDKKKDDSDGSMTVCPINFSSAANLPLRPKLDRLRIISSAPGGPLPIALAKQPSNRNVFIGVWASVSDLELKRREASVPQADHNISEPAQLPVAVTVQINEKWTGLRFMHALKGAGELNETVFEYIVKYVDGSNVKIPVREGERIAGQLKPLQVSDGKKVFTSIVANRSVNIYSTDWINPHPDKKIASVTIRASKQKVIPVLISLEGLSGIIRPADEQLETDNVQISINMLKKIRPVRNGLFAMNCPYVFKVENGKYSGLLPKFKFSQIRIWNRLHPEKEWTEPETAKLQKYGRKGLAASEGGKTGIMLNLFGDIPKWIMASPSPEQYTGRFCKWYVRLLDYYINEMKWPVVSVELFNERLIGHPAEENRVRYEYFNALAVAIKRKFPQIQIGGTAECWPDLKILEQFTVACGSNLDILTWHLYATGKSSTDTMVLLKRSNYMADISQKIAAILKKRVPGRKIAQSITEFNLNYAAWVNPVDLRQVTGDGVVWVMSVLRHLLYDGEVESAFYWHYWGGGTYGIVDGLGAIRPNGMLYYLLNRHLVGLELYAAASESPEVEVLAARGEGKTVLVFINKSDRNVKIKSELLNSGHTGGDGLTFPVTCYRIGGTEKDFTVTRETSLIPEKGIITLDKRSILFKVMEKTQAGGNHK